MLERLTKRHSNSRPVVFSNIDSCNPRMKEVVVPDLAVLNGERSQQFEHLSPCEFVIRWEAVLCKYPNSEDVVASECHAELTALGKKNCKMLENSLHRVTGDQLQLCSQAWIMWCVSQRNMKSGYPFQKYLQHNVFVTLGHLSDASGLSRLHSVGRQFRVVVQVKEKELPKLL